MALKKSKEKKATTKALLRELKIVIIELHSLVLAGDCVWPTAAYLVRST